MTLLEQFLLALSFVEQEDVAALLLDLADSSLKIVSIQLLQFQNVEVSSRRKTAIAAHHKLV